jgi:hypothetical protein
MVTESNLSAADILDKIQYTINNSDTTVATYLLSWLNNRYFDVLNRHKNWPFLQTEDTTTLTFTSAAVTATLPADFKSSTVVYMDNKKLVRAELWQIRKNDPDRSDTASKPTHYYFPDEEGPGQTIAIYPSLTSGSMATLSVVYQKELTPLNDSASSYPLIPNRHRSNILEIGVVSDYYTWKQQFEKAASYDHKYENAIMRMEIEQGMIKSNDDEEWVWRWDDHFGIDTPDVL